MNADQLKQWISLAVSALGALYLALKASGLNAEFLNPDKLNAWANFFTTIIPLILAGYGIYLNTYVMTKKGKQQDEYLKDKGLK